MTPSIGQSASVITVFLQGLLSFFSPCVLPLLPVYIGYLSGGTLTAGPDGTKHYDRGRLIVNTIFYVFGIGFAFFLLGLGMRAIGRFFAGNQLLFARIGGVIVVLFGLYQLGLFGPSVTLSRERRLPVRIDQLAMSPLTALLMGFVFSFAWTPCVGPVLSGVLLMAASAGSSAAGFLYIAVYTLGFAIPFLLTGLFAGTLLNYFQKHRNIVRYTEKIGGILLVFMGILMLSGQMNHLSGYLSQISGQTEVSNTMQSETPGSTASSEDGGDTTAAASSPDSVSTDAPADSSESVAATESAAIPAANANVDSSESQTASSVSAAESAADAGSDTSSSSSPDSDSESANAADTVPAPDFTLTDQYGKTHRLSDYRGKIVFLNFWATWCPPCRAEMPDIQKLYEETLADPDSDLVILGVAFPSEGQEKDEAGIAAFLEENGYTYPTVMDTGATLAPQYYITAFPTTFMIDREGNVFGYLPGSMNRETMDYIIQQTRDNS